MFYSFLFLFIFWISGYECFNDNKWIHWVGNDGDGDYRWGCQSSTFSGRDNLSWVLTAKRRPSLGCLFVCVVCGTSHSRCRWQVLVEGTRWQCADSGRWGSRADRSRVIWIMEGDCSWFCLFTAWKCHDLIHMLRGDSSCCVENGLSRYMMTVGVTIRCILWKSRRTTDMDWPSIGAACKGHSWLSIGFVGGRICGTCSSCGWGCVTMRQDPWWALSILFSHMQKWWCCFLWWVLQRTFESFSWLLGIRQWL